MLLYTYPFLGIDDRPDCEVFLTRAAVQLTYHQVAYLTGRRLWSGHVEQPDFAWLVARGASKIDRIALGRLSQPAIYRPYLVEPPATYPDFVQAAQASRRVQRYGDASLWRD